MALQPIADAAHLVHGPASCGNGSWAFRPTCSSGPLLHRESFTTDLSEIDVIRGGEGKLLKAIGSLIARYKTPAVFVYQTCLPAMIGDDIAAVCRAASARWSLPVVAVDAPGIAGSRPYGGYRAGEVLLDRVIGSREPDQTTSTDVVLIGEFNLAGEMDQIRPLLGELGIRVLASITGDGRFADIAAAHRARAAVLLCSQGLDGLAEGLFVRYGIPFFEGSFHGIANTSNTLRRLARLLANRGAPADLPVRAEALIRDRESGLARALAGYRARLAGKCALLLSGGVKSWSIAATLRDAGLEMAGVSVGKTSEGDRRKVARALGSEAAMIHEWQDGALEALLASGKVDIVLGGGEALFSARRARIPGLEINHGRSHALCGYDGVMALLAQIDRNFANPLWSHARRPAPWRSKL
jgi:nitrogenase molybdenum-cofactor synthesis protein NifE